MLRRLGSTVLPWCLGLCTVLAAAAPAARAQAPAPPPFEAASADTDLSAIFASADTSLDGNQWDDAIDKYTQALREQPNNENVLNARGWAWLQKGNLDNALADYDAALAVNPQFVLAIANRGALYRQKGDVEKANQDLSLAIQLDPNDPNAYALRGDLAADRGDYQAAIDDFSRGIRAVPPENRKFLSSFYASRASAYDQLGNLPAALNDCYISTEFDSVNERAWSVEGAVCNQKGDSAGAIAAWLVAVKCNPSSAENLNGLAWLRATCQVAQFRDGKTAVEYATRACELTEYKDAEFLDTLAATYAETGDFENAVTWEYGAIDLAPDDRKAGMQKRAKLYEAHQPYRDDGHTGS